MLDIYFHKKILIHHFLFSISYQGKPLYTFGYLDDFSLMTASNPSFGAIIGISHTFSNPRFGGLSGKANLYHLLIMNF
jgi:hypothetical protein